MQVTRKEDVPILTHPLILFLRDTVGEADGTCGADNPAEVTAHALRPHDTWLARGGVEDNGLMAAVVAGHLATSAAHTLLAVNLRIDNGLTIQLGGLYKQRHRLAHKVCHVRHSTLGHIALQTQYQVVDDAVAVLHHGRTNLYVVTTQLDELKGIAPRLYATDATEFDRFAVTTMHNGVLGHIEDEAQGYGLDSTAGEARHRLTSGNGRTLVHGDALDGVDGRDGIGIGKVGCHGRIVDMGDVGRHLRNDGNADMALHVGSIEQHQLRVLPHVAAHARQSHLRTGEVQLDGIDTRILGHLRQFYPLLLGLSHDGGNDNLRGVVLLQSAEDVKVHLHGVLAQLLHIAEAIEVAVDAIAVDGIETWRHFLDFLKTNGLVIHTGPSCLESTRHHLVVRTDGRGGQEERILTMQTTEVHLKAGVFPRHVIRTDSAEHLLDAYGPIIVDTGLLGTLQVGIATVGYPA